MSRQILFIPVEIESKRCGDWFELSKSDRVNFKMWYGEVRLRYPRDLYDILILTTADKVPMMEVVPYKGTYLVQENDPRTPVEKILDIEPDGTPSDGLPDDDRMWYEDSGEANYWRRG